MKLGGFVIHGDSADTLPNCLRSLHAVCDTVVAVDSGSQDGSRDISERTGARVLDLPWQGYGAARAAAVSALTDVDYVFFLDSDEWLTAEGESAIRAWKASAPDAPAYRVVRNNWVQTEGHRFLLFRDRRARLVRRDRAVWAPRMVVHESLPREGHRQTRIAVEHLYASDAGERLGKNDLYALLWAVQAHAEGRRPKSTLLLRTAHFARKLILQGAWFRGGWTGARLAWLASRYHARKHQLLERVTGGELSELVGAYAAQDYRALMREAKARITDLA
ncbi:MAG TPA: glycosyltransferase [Myxococcaceae bacterium]|nr:glycosyltransferase [Myxococcaceae bacterium]